MEKWVNYGVCGDYKMSQDITTMADGFTNGVHHPLAIYMGIHIPYQMIFNGEPELLDFPNRRMIKSQLSHVFPISAVQFYERPHFQTLTLQACLPHDGIYDI